MPRKNARQRSRYSPEVGKVRGVIYKHAIERATDAHQRGFDLEAIVLVESMLADRLESILSLIAGKPTKFGTAAEAASALRTTLDAAGSKLLDDVTVWCRDRSRWVHEFAKVSDEGHLAWEDRLADASRVAEKGLALLSELSAEAKSIARDQAKAATAAHSPASSSHQEASALTAD